MSAPKVDVLAVLRDVIRYEAKANGAPDWIAELKAVRAAVARMVEAQAAFVAEAEYYIGNPSAWDCYSENVSRLIHRHVDAAKASQVQP